MATITLKPTQITYISRINTKKVMESEKRATTSDSWGNLTLSTLDSTWSGGSDKHTSESYVYPTTDKTTAWGSWTYNTTNTYRYRYKTETSTHKMMLVQFDTSGVEGTITGASLRVYATGGGATAATPDIYKITGTWAASTVTWNAQPEMSVILSAQKLSLKSWASYNVFSALSGYGFALYDGEYGDNQKKKEIPKTGDYAPQLVVTYTPYNSKIKSVTSSVAMDGTSKGTVTLERYNDAYTHTVKVSLGSQSQTFTGVATSVDFTLPASWVSQVPNATQGVATVTCWTYDASGNQVGTTSSATFNAVVPDSVVPTVTLDATVVNDNDIVNGWGIYLQGFSKVKLTAKATAGTGASISKYAFSGSGVSQSGTSNVCTSGVLTEAGSITWKVVITDSRGRTTTASVTKSIVKYSAPSVPAPLAYRCLQDGTRDDYTGTYGQVQGTYSIASCSGKNTATAVLRYAQYGKSSYTTIKSGAENGVLYQFGDGNLDVTKSYVVELTVTDALGASSKASTIINTVVGPLFLGLKGDRISFGKPVSRAGLDCHFPAYFRDTVNFEGKVLGLTKLLWTNPNPSAEFAAQEIRDIGDYDFYLISFFDVAGGGYPTLGFTVGQKMTLPWKDTVYPPFDMTSSTMNYIRKRTGNIHIELGCIHFGDCTKRAYGGTDSSASTDNTLNVPYQIWGFDLMD